MTPSLSSSRKEVSLKIPCTPIQIAMRAVVILMTILGPSLQRVLFILLKFQHTVYLSSNPERSDLFKYQGIKLYFFILVCTGNS